MSYQVTSGEWADIDDVPLHTPGWTCDNLFELWQGADTRGEPTIIPEADGGLANPIRPTPTRRELVVTVNGLDSWDGDPYDNHRDGLQANLAHLEQNVKARPDSGLTRRLVLHLPDGATKEGDVQVIHWKLTPIGPAAVALQIGLLIPAGDLELIAAGS